MEQPPTVTVRFNLSFYPAKYCKCDVGVTLSGVSSTAPDRDVEAASLKAHELLAKAMHDVYGQAKESVHQHRALTALLPEENGQ